MPLTRPQVYTRCERVVTSLREQYPEALISFHHDFNMNTYRFQMILGMQAYHHALSEEILSEEGVDCFGEMIEGCRNFYRQNTTRYAPIGALQQMRPGDIVFNRDGVPIGAVESIEMNHDSYSMEYLMELRVTNRSTRLDYIEQAGRSMRALTDARDREREALMRLMDTSTQLIIPEDMRPPETVEVIGPSGTFDFATEAGTVDRVVLEEGAEISRRSTGAISSMGTVRNATCSICGASVSDEESCGHERGSQYDTEDGTVQLCTWLIGGMTLHSVGIDSLGDSAPAVRRIGERLSQTDNIHPSSDTPFLDLAAAADRSRRPAEESVPVSSEEVLPEVFCTRFSIADFFMDEAGTL